VSIAFAPGAVTALIGPNSAGKTTLLKAVIGLVRSDAGRVLLNGDPVDPAGAYRGGIGYMPQLPAFPPHMTGHELVEMVDDLRGFEGEPDESLIDDLDVREDMGKPFGELSGGTRQKVNAALAFRYRPDVLILDEPTAGLDPVAALTLKRKIRERRKAGATVVVTSHDLGSLESLAEDIVFLLEGRLRFHASLDELLEETGQRSLEGAIAELMLRGRGAGDEMRPGRDAVSDSARDPGSDSGSDPGHTQGVA
jgi:Cu-processing system ATP-binding protein